MLVIHTWPWLTCDMHVSLTQYIIEHILFLGIKGGSKMNKSDMVPAVKGL